MFFIIQFTHNVVDLLNHSVTVRTRVHSAREPVGNIGIELRKSGSHRDSNRMLRLQVVLYSVLPME